MLIHQMTQMLIEEIPLAPMEEWLTEIYPNAREHIQYCKKYNLSLCELFGGSNRKGKRKFELTDNEFLLVKAVSKYRNDMSRLKEYNNMHRDDNEKEMNNEIIGVGGEFGHSIYHGIYPYESMLSEPHPTLDDYGDFTHRVELKRYSYIGNCNFDSKGTSFDKGRLLLNPRKISGHKENAEKAKTSFCDKIDAFSFFTVFPEGKKIIKFNGYMTSKDLLNRELRDFGGKGMPCYWAFQEELTYNINDIYRAWFKSRR